MMRWAGAAGWIFFAAIMLAASFFWQERGEEFAAALSLVGGVGGLAFAVFKVITSRGGSDERSP